MEVRSKLAKARFELQNVLSPSAQTLSKLLVGSLMILGACFSQDDGKNLVVTPGQKQGIKIGEETFGLGPKFTGASITEGYDGVALTGRMTVTESALDFQYARSSIPHFYDVITGTLETSTFGVVKLRTFLNVESPVIDYATEETVLFFEKVLKRNPNSPEEAAKIDAAIRKAFAASCMRGVKPLSLDHLDRVMNNAFFASPEYMALFVEYKIPDDVRADYVKNNSSPQILSANPYPTLFDTVSFEVPENYNFVFNVRVFDNDHDVYTTQWLINGKPWHEFPFAAALSESGSDLPDPFTPPQELDFMTDYSMATRLAPAHFSVELQLCDGGPLQSYKYAMTVTNTNRPPVITKAPLSPVPLRAGVETTVEIEAKDIDGDPLFFSLSNGAQNNVYLTQGDVFEEAKKLKGLFMQDQPNRNTTAPVLRPLLADPWLETLRTSAISVPYSLEFFKDTDTLDKVKVTFADRSVTPPLLTTQISPIEWSWAPTPGSITNAGEILRFTIDSVNLTSPRVIANAKMFCIVSEIGARSGYASQVACNMDKLPGPREDGFPLNFDRDGEWLFTMRCPDAGKDEIPTVANVYNNRCSNIEANYSVAPSTDKYSVGSVKLTVRLDRDQIKARGNSTFSELVTVVDAIGGPATVVVPFTAVQEDAPAPATQWTQADFYETFKRPLGGSPDANEPTRVETPSIPLFALDHPFARKANYDYCGFGGQSMAWECYGALAKYPSRSPAAFAKANWWQYIRWDLFEDSSTFLLVPDSDLAIFNDAVSGNKASFIRFVTGSPASPDDRLIVSRDLGALASADQATANLSSPVEFADVSANNATGSKVFKYKVLASGDTGFDIEIPHARGTYGQSVFCRAQLNFSRGSRFPTAPAPDAPPIDSDWQLRCGSSLNAAAAKNTYLRFSMGPQGLINETRQAALGPTAFTDYANPIWLLYTQQYRDNGGIHESYENYTQYNKDQLSRVFSIQFMGAPAVWNFNPQASSDEQIVDFPFRYFDSATDLKAQVYPKTRRIVFPTGGIPHRWCTYGLRARGTLLVLTCQNSDPGSASNYPPLYGTTTGYNTLTMEYSLNPYFYAYPNNAFFEGTLGAPKVAYTKSFSAAAAFDTDAEQVAANNFTILGVRFAGLATRLTFDDSAWNIPNPANVQSDRPTISSLVVEKAGLGGVWGPVPTPSATLYLGSDSGIPTLWQDPSNNTLPLEWYGLPDLARNQVYFTWQPTLAGQYRFKITLTQTNGSTTLNRTAVIYAVIEDYVPPPTINLTATAPSLPALNLPLVTAPRWNRSITTIPNTGGGADYHVVKFFNQKEIRIVKGKASNKKAEVQLSFVGPTEEYVAFWLVDNNGVLVDPAVSGWAEDPNNWPFEIANGAVAINANQITITDTRRNGATSSSPSTPVGSASYAVGPGFPSNGVNGSYILNQQPAGGLLTSATFLTTGSASTPAHPFKDVASISLNATSFTVDSIGVIASDSDPNSSGDFRIRGIDLSTFSADVTKNAACRAIWTVPTGTYFPTSTSQSRTNLKLFCAQMAGASYTIDPTFANQATDVTADIWASQGLRTFSLKADFSLTCADASTCDHSLRQTRLPLSDNNLGFWVENLAKISWGDPNLRVKEGVTHFRAVAVVASTLDNTYVTYKPVEFISKNDDPFLPDSISPIVTGVTLPQCASSNQTLKSAGPDLKIDCLLPDYAVTSAAYLYNMTFTTPTGGSLFDISAALVKETDPTTLGACVSPTCLRYLVDATKWSGYDQSVTYRPTLTWQNVGSGSPAYRWRFQWQIPPFVRNQLGQRDIGLKFDPSFDFARKLYPQTYVGNTAAPSIFTDPTMRLYADTGKFAQVSNGTRDLIELSQTPGTLNTWKIDLSYSFTEPNIRPCVLDPASYVTITTSSSVPSVTGLACPTQPDAAAFNTFKNNYLVQLDGTHVYRSVTSAQPSSNTALDETVAIMYEKVPPELIPESVNPAQWRDVFEGDHIKIPLYAYDQNVSPNSVVQTLDNWVLQAVKLPSGGNAPSFLALTNTYSGISKVFVRESIATITPTDSDIIKNDPSGNGGIFEFTTKIADLASLGNSSAPRAVEDISIRLWDRNFPPVLPSNTLTATHQGKNTRVSGSFTISDPDAGDQITATVLTTDADLNLRIDSSVQSSISPNKWTFNYSFLDVPRLKDVASLDLRFLINDVPWTQTATNGASYLAHHPKPEYMLPSPDQILTVTSKLAESPVLYGSTTRARKAYLSQSFIEPISIRNPDGRTLSCSIASRPSLSSPATSDYAIIKNNVTLPGSSVIPGTSQCLLVWTPTDLRWKSYPSPTVKVNVSLSPLSGQPPAAYTVTFNFTVLDYQQPGNGARSSLTSAALDVFNINTGAEVALNSDFTDSAPTVTGYTISDGDKVRLRLHSLFSGVSTYTWFLDGNIVGQANEGDTTVSYDFSPSVNNSGDHDIALLVVDNAVDLNQQGDKGFFVARARINSRNSIMISSASDFVPMAINGSSYNPRAMFVVGNLIHGMSEKIITVTGQNLASFPYRINFALSGTSRLKLISNPPGKSFFPYTDYTYGAAALGGGSPGQYDDSWMTADLGIRNTTTYNSTNDSFSTNYSTTPLGTLYSTADRNYYHVTRTHASFTQSGSKYVFNIDHTHPANPTITKVQGSLGANTPISITPTWLVGSSVSFLNVATAVSTGIDGTLIIRAQAAGQSNYKFYLLRNPASNSPSIAEITDGSGHTLDATSGGAIWVAPCRQVTCSATMIEAGILYLNNGNASSSSTNFKFGLLDVDPSSSSATLSLIETPLGSGVPNPHINIRTATDFDGSKSVQPLGYLFPTKNSTSTRQSAHLFVMIQPGQASYSTINLDNGLSIPGGMAKAQFSSVACDTDSSFCYLSDAGNGGLWRLK